MQWTRVTKLSATLAVLSFIAIGAPLATYWVKAEVRRRAEAPDPVVATPAETRAILSAVLEDMQFVGVPPPPPAPGQAPRPEPVRALILTDLSLCFARDKPKPGCESEDRYRLLIPELDPFAPRKLREELAEANQEPRQLSLSGIPKTEVVRSKDIERIFAGGWWDEFYRRHPGTAGYARISQPVLTKDRQQALIFVAHHCDGLCGTGTLHLLARSGVGWRVVKKELLWIS